MGKCAKKTRPGFTILEVVLFLAVSGFLMVGLMVGVGSAIARQRYNDSVQDFAEFLRKTYADILTFENPRKNSIGNDNFCNISSNLPLNDKNEVEFNIKKYTEGSRPPYKSAANDGLPGRTNCAYYGKLITFGELAKNSTDDANKSTIFAYDVVGKDYIELIKKREIREAGDGSAGSRMKNIVQKLDIEALTLVPEQKGEEGAATECKIAPVGLVNKYVPQWQARIENEKEGGELFKGSVLILRSPVTGRLHTFYNNKNFKIQDFLLSNNSVESCKSLRDKANSASMSDVKIAFDDGSEWKESEYWPETASEDDRISFCVGSSDVFAAGGKRRNILINNISGNASSVELIPQDSAENRCK